MFKFIKALFEQKPESRKASLPGSEKLQSEGPPQQAVAQTRGLHQHSSASESPEIEAFGAYGVEDEGSDGRFEKTYPERKRQASDAYFSTMGQMQQAISDRNYAEAARLARANLHQLLPWLEEQKQNGDDSGPPPSIPALGHGGTMMALVGDRQGLEEMRRLVNGTAALQHWAEAVDGHFEDLELVPAILSTVQTNPGCLQANIKALVGANDGRRVATLIGWLEKGGQLVRVKEKKTYRLYLAGANELALEAPAPSAPAAPIRSHRKGKPALNAREIDVGSLPLVPLPHSPPYWQERDRVKEVSAPAEGAFELSNAPGWHLENIASIPMPERPDPAFRHLYAMPGGLLLVDDLGNAEGLRAPASALRYARDGREIARGPLRHDVYRLEVNPLGHGFIGMSRAAVVHAYDENLQSLLETSLPDSPEVRALQSRVEMHVGDLKGLVRSIALSPENQSYLVTVMDEAWCLGLGGEGRWALKMPLKEGWTRVTDRSGMVGTSTEITEALFTLSLSLPITPEQVKSQYRTLAKQHHPDVNPAPDATERMKALSHAASVLTGLDEDFLSGTVRARYRQAGQSSTINVGDVSVTLEMGYEAGEMHAADWIYASSFGPNGVAYLASYTGRVIVVDSDGTPRRAYDIGSVPRRIADAGDFLYLLTDTRLYVLQGDALYAVVDTFQAGSLIVGETGFGVLEPKLFRWFSTDGRLLGSVVSKDPIRRVYDSPGGLIVESRTRRAVIKGAPAWWST